MKEIKIGFLRAIGFYLASIVVLAIFTLLIMVILPQFNIDLVHGGNPTPVTTGDTMIYAYIFGGIGLFLILLLILYNIANKEKK